MIIDFKLLDSAKVINQNILKALLPETNKYLVKVVNKLKTTLPLVVKATITNSPEYQSLLSGQLKYEFGIPDSQDKVANLIELWSTRININYNPLRISNNQLKGSFSASMIRIDFSDVLYSDYAIVVDNFRGYSLPWLEWLLLKGNSTIIKNQRVIIGPNKASRTGLAVMRDSSASWKVPSQFAGTIDDNWITRALDSAESNIEQTIDRAMNV